MGPPYVIKAKKIPLRKNTERSCEFLGRAVVAIPHGGNGDYSPVQTPGRRPALNKADNNSAEDYPQQDDLENIQKFQTN